MDSWATADQVWAGGLIFARVAAILMLIPCFGEAYVPPRVRLSLSLVISLALWPVVRGALPGLPDSLGLMVGWIIREVVVGLMIGLLLRMFMTALSTAGEIVSLQTTLSFAQTANPMQAQPGTTIAAFLETFPDSPKGDGFGWMSWSPPFTYHFRYGDIEADFIFLALEKEDDVKKLRSLEVTGIYFNELQYIPLSMFTEGLSRTGRSWARRRRSCWSWPPCWP